MSLILLVSSILLRLASRVSAEFPDCQNGPELLRTNLVCNTSAPFGARASAIVSAMTLAEKLNNTGSTSPGVPRLGLPAYQWWQEGILTCSTTACCKRD